MASPRRLQVHIVDDSTTQAEIARALPENAGHAVTVSNSSLTLRDIPARCPTACSST
jgi:hypothetical protein